MFELRDYQQKASKQGLEILNKHHILILNYEVRTGKTHIALDIAKNYNKVLFVTKKKAITSIEKDYTMANHSFDLTIINYESLHKVRANYDLVICDESHTLGAYPKPSNRTKELKEQYSNCDYILMTGTLLPESNAQIYHQLFVSKYSPFAESNFYKWHKIYGTPKVKYTSYGQAKDYSDVEYNKINKFIEPIKLSYTQKEAGFKSEIKEHILEVKMRPITNQLIKRLKKDLVIEGEDEVILADTGVKLMQKVHQLSSGTVKFESGNSQVIDPTKAEFIRWYFKGKKLAIFYKFKAELVAIKSKLDVTQDIEEFNTTDKHIALQIVSGREGINLSRADYIVYFNIDFSAVSYWQSRDRMTTQERQKNNVYWLFSKGGIEHKIYNAVSNKKDYTLQTFKKDEI
jgi:DNA-binding transcriptional regulator YiaG